jgi:hypothetical protein
MNSRKEEENPKEKNCETVIEHLKKAVGLSVGVSHVAAVHIEAERGEEGHEERLRGVRIPHPDRLPPFLRYSTLCCRLISIQQRGHHPVLDAVLPPDPTRRRRPRWERRRRRVGGGGVGRHHADVEARGQVVHEDAERRGRSGRAPSGEGPEVEERAAGGGSGGGGGEVEEGGGERDEEQQERRAQGHRAAARRPHADTAAAGAEAEWLACGRHAASDGGRDGEFG